MITRGGDAGKVSSLLLVGALALAACGSSSGSEEGADRSSTTAKPAGTTAPEAKPNTVRPEGDWTLVSVQLKRSDAPDLEPGLASVALASFEPSCESGPCDLEASPAGVDGTYLPEGYTVTDTGPSKRSTYTWQEADETYTRTSEPTTSGCTTVDLKVVPDAYRQSATTTLRFRPGVDGGPASLTGTTEQKITSTPAGEAAGCTPYTETRSVVGTPTGALLDDEELDLAGSYETTEALEKIEPEGQQPPGFAGSVGTFEVTTEGEGYAVTGVLKKPVTLERSEQGLSGAAGDVTTACATTPETPDGFIGTETFTELAPLALTEDGDPILGGRWNLLEEPTPAGTAVDCQRSSNTGYIILIPVGSLG